MRIGVYGRDRTRRLYYYLTHPDKRELVNPENESSPTPKNAIYTFRDDTRSDERTVN